MSMLEYFSPRFGYRLQEIEGSAQYLLATARQIVTSAETMEKVLVQLRSYEGDMQQIGLSIDAFKSNAQHIIEQMEPAEVRYRITGDALEQYATALGDIQPVLNPLVPEIIILERASRAALDDLMSAVGAQETVDGIFDDQTPEHVRARAVAADAVESARAELAQLQLRLRDAWNDYETYFTRWSDEYEACVDRIQMAIVAAGNNDGIFGFIDDVATVIGVAAVGALALASLPFMGPAAAVLGVAGVLTTGVLAAGGYLNPGETFAGVVSSIPGVSGAVAGTQGVLGGLNLLGVFGDGNVVYPDPPRTPGEAFDSGSTKGRQLSSTPTDGVTFRSPWGSEFTLDLPEVDSSSTGTVIGSKFKLAQDGLTMLYPPRPPETRAY